MDAAQRFVRSAWRSALILLPTAVLSGCRDEPTATVAYWTVEPSLGSPPSARAGSILQTPPTFIVRNAAGQLLANVAVKVEVTAGNGTLRNTPTRTRSGATPIGDWTLDTLAGRNEVTITAESAPPVTIEVVGVAGPPARLQVTGDEQSGLAGDILPQPLLVTVADRYGNGITGVDVVLAVAEGGGVVTPDVFRTDVAAGTSLTWRLGRKGGNQALLATAAGLSLTIRASIRSDFTPRIRFVTGTPDPQVENAFRAAADRLRAIITSDLSDVPVFSFDLARCGLPPGQLTEVVDDVVMYATISPIDGAERVLAAAGPCIKRTSSGMPVIGTIRLDSDDIPGLLSNGRLEPVILHEMLHVMGVGSEWWSRGLVRGAGSADPRFTGLLAATECVAAGGNNVCGDHSVPLENVGGSGTVEVHWREAIFDSELMTGVVEPSGDMPLSAMTIASLADLGLVVNPLSADPYLIPPIVNAAPRIRRSGWVQWETLTRPRFEVGLDGWIRPLANPLSPG